MAVWQPQVLDPAIQYGHVLVHYRQHFLCTAEGLLFSSDRFRQIELPLVCKQGLGYFNGVPVHLYELAGKVEIPGTAWYGLRQLMVGEHDPELLSMLRFATQIGTWAIQNRFCGSCGTPMTPLAGERAMCCVACQVRHYPRLSPSMIVLVTRGDEILLARSPRHASGVYSTLAGFVEPGESVEQCVAREVLEEVGVTIDQPHYIASQNWPFPYSLMLGFHARYTAGEIVPQPTEIDDAQWFSIQRLPGLPGVHSIARYLIDLYVAERLGREPPRLPV
ncbi:NAD(+) diphosphatase [Azomonas macrocytogenes]|uniref:NAD-capped RNA hydrolase NudC n=1 Tax=Azomonas macrocytogenes TaxID=69962 RepID=A0A839T4R9_AZOMA|nr:NAD+ diphosphatase [Azomonas macrocytogenes]